MDSPKRAFDTEQSALRERVQRGDAVYVFLDPDGTWNDWLGVLVRAPTGVIYGNQCAGLLTSERLLEGFYVPIAGPKYNADDGAISGHEFSEVFHSLSWPRQGGRAKDEAGFPHLVGPTPGFGASDTPDDGTAPIT